MAVFPRDWQRIVVKKKHLQFAWGPAGGGLPAAVGAVGTGRAAPAGAGGKGSTWIDGLLARRTRVGGAIQSAPKGGSLRPSVPGHAPHRMHRPEPLAGWHSGSVAASQRVMLDFIKHREYGGMVYRLGPGGLRDRLSGAAF
ncbi:MAG: hypothetical protein MZV65_47595 [Chromatiales bacterium]|nr:hypothetical protein [Chromatiales bacterium]